MSNIIITGVTGQLGQFLAKYIQDNYSNIQIIGTFRHKTDPFCEFIFDKTKAVFELMELNDQTSIESLIIKYKPIYFVNTAANAFVGDSWKVPVQHIQQNCIGVLYQLEAIRKHSPDTRYFNMGTSEEFGCTSDNGLQNESTIINPKSPYGASKAAARYLINIYRQSYNLYAVQNWTYNFESELRGYQYVTKKVTLGAARIRKEIDNNKSITPIELGNLDSVRSWQFAGDVADSIWKSLNNPLGPKDYVVASSNCNTIRELVEKAFAYANIPGYWQNNMYLKSSGEVLVCTNPKFVRPSDVTFLKGDSSLIQKELGWKSTLTFDQLVKRMVEYDLNHANFDRGILS